MLKHSLRALALVLVPATLLAQRTVSVVPGPQYEAGSLHRTLFGDAWRDLWTTTVTAPVLDLATYAGGLTPFREGGNQTRTLRFNAGDGRIYIFRSTNKVVSRALPDDLRDSPAGDIIQDQTAALHPTGQLTVAPLLEAARILHAVPTLVVMPDDPKLGEFRGTFANMLGFIEEWPNEAEDESKTFARAEKIKGTEEFLLDLEDSMEDYLDAREYLTARLIDFIIGDTDRGADQWRWARFETGDRDLYRPIPRDRDYAFMNSGGLLISLVATSFDKLVKYGPAFPKLGSLVFMTREFDRAHLSELSWADWQNVIVTLQSKLSDDVIERALARMPLPHRQTSGQLIAEGLRARRDALPTIAREYYMMVSEDADVFGSSESEFADIYRHSDGSVTVRLFREGAGTPTVLTDADNVSTATAPASQQPAPAQQAAQPTSQTAAAAQPAWQRRFLPNETQEIRVYLDRGHDYAIVRGRAQQSIKVRVIGGEGNDILIDSSAVAQGGDLTAFYDAHGRNTFVRGPNTRVDERRFETPPPFEPEPEEGDDPRIPRVVREERRGRYQDLLNNEGQDFVATKTRAQAYRTWGNKFGWSPAADLRDGPGLILGVGPTWTDYGFRRSPYESRVALRALYAFGSSGVGAELLWNRHFENSRWSYSLLARGTQFEANRFYGFGNNTPEIDSRVSLVMRDEVRVQPALNYAFSPRNSISFGPVFRYTSPDLPVGSPIAVLEPLGSESFAQLGGLLETALDFTTGTLLDRSGLALRMGAAGYPAVLDADEPFGQLHAQANAYWPLGSQALALRVGARRALGEFPLHEAAFLGGGQDLRGFRWNRFAGDAAVFGGAELRAPLTRITLLTRGDLGVLALADAGRVWFNGDSDGGWHTAFGGGLWFATLGQAFSVTYAKGEEGRLNLYLGFPF